LENGSDVFAQGRGRSAVKLSVSGKMNIGWCYYKLGDKKNAKENLKQAVFYEEFMCLAWYVLGIIAKEEGASDEAVSNFQNAVKKNRKRPPKSCEITRCAL
jgi:Tfp pilus assembly protein PilF